MKAIVLAAGKGTRLMSEQNRKPKVLREACGRPLIGYVLENIDFIEKEDTYVVVGYMGDAVKEYVGREYKFAEQVEQKGTGHAVMMCEPQLRNFDGDVLIVYGDMPLFKKETYDAVCKKHSESGAVLTLLTADVPNPPPYGRIIRDENGKILGSVEDKDCTPEQKKITELNVGVYVADSKTLFNTLKKVGNNNAQGEYYLTDIAKILIEEGQKVESHTTFDMTEILGVNTVEDLELCEEILTNKR